MKKNNKEIENQNNEVAVNRAYLYLEKSKMEGQLSIKEKDYNEFKLRNDNDARSFLGPERPNKKFEEVLFGTAVKMTIQIVFDKRLLDITIMRM